MGVGVGDIVGTVVGKVVGIVVGGVVVGTVVGIVVGCGVGSVVGVLVGPLPIVPAHSYAISWECVLSMMRTTTEPGGSGIAPDMRAGSLAR